MRGIFILFLSAFAAAGAAFAGLRLRHKWAPITALAAASALGGSLYCALFYVLPANMGIFSDSFQEPSPKTDFVNGFIFLILFLHSFWSFLYMARGGLAKILLRLDFHNKHGQTRTELQKYFQKSAATDAFISRRLARLIRSGYLKRSPGRVRILPSGARVARLSSNLRRVFDAGTGG